MNEHLSVCCGLLISLITINATPTNATPATANLPMIGDCTKAAPLIKAGTAAVASGKWADAETDFKDALRLCAFNEDATIGLARCAAAQGNLIQSIEYYKQAIYPHSDTGDVKKMTEYLFVLIHAGDWQDAVPVYNHLIDLWKINYFAEKMEIPAPTFTVDTMDANASNLMEAMAHVIRAASASDVEYKVTPIEMQQAMKLAPGASAVFFYQGVFLNRAHRSGAKEAFERALSLDDGSNTHINEQRLNTFK